MDIFGTITNGINLAIDIKRLFEEVQGASQTLQQLRNEIQEMETLLKECERVCTESMQSTQMFIPLLQRAEELLGDLKNAVTPYCKKASKSITLSTPISMKMYFNESKFQKFTREIERQTLKINFMCT